MIKIITKKKYNSLLEKSVENSVLKLKLMYVEGVLEDIEKKHPKLFPSKVNFKRNRL